MKLVTAVIAPYRWAEVRDALEMVGISGMTVTEGVGSGHRHPHGDRPSDTYRSPAYDAPLSAHVRLEVVVEDAEVGRIVAAVVQHARTDTGIGSSSGGGKVWVRPVDSVVRVRTRDEDRAAL